MGKNKGPTRPHRASHREGGGGVGVSGTSRPEFANEILRELQALRAEVVPRARSASHADGELEAAVDSMRRLLSEMLESRIEALLGDLVAVRLALTDRQMPDPGVAVSKIDRLLDRVGAIEYKATRLDFVDPAIHEIWAERRLPDLPDGVIVETLRSGFRSARGRLLAKACVAVNRRAPGETQHGERGSEVGSRARRRQV